MGSKPRAAVERTHFDVHLGQQLNRCSVISASRYFQMGPTGWFAVMDLLPTSKFSHSFTYIILPYILSSVWQIFLWMHNKLVPHLKIIRELLRTKSRSLDTLTCSDEI